MDPLTSKEYAACLKALRVIGSALKKMKVEDGVIEAYRIVNTAIVEHG
jgi:hypothetical protein